MGTEIELKLLIAGKNLPRLRQALDQYSNGAKLQSRYLLNRYFDTSAFQLWKNKIALRVRQSDGRWVQTLKGGGGMQAGIHQRDEWETPVDNDSPDLDRFAAAFSDDDQLQHLLKELRDRQDIQAVFSTDFHREAVMLTLPDGTEVEAAIDKGMVRAGTKRKPISELELELKSGNPTAVFDFARRLLAVVPLAIGTISKAERGYTLLQLENPAVPRRAQPVQFDASTTVDEVFARIFAECFAHLLENIDGVIAGRDPEYLHQMRVAIRRLRGALSVFGDVVPEAMLAGIAPELQRAGQILGEARNWDVLRHETLPAYQHAANSPISAELAACLQQGAQQATAKAIRLVRSRRFTDLLLATGACINGRAWRQSATETTLAALSDSIGVFAQQVIGQRRRRLEKRVAAIDIDRLETLHAVRIAAKKLRYSMQFFAVLFPSSRAESFARSLTGIQDLLGQVNDGAIASTLLANAANDSSALLTEVRAIETWLQEQLRSNRSLFVKIWRRFSKLPAIFG